MSHPVHSVRSFQIVGPFILKVQFDDGITRIIDFSPVLHGEVYCPLRDPALFEAVRTDADAHTLVWPNGADFDPATLHDWPELGDKLAAMARSWSMASSESRDKAS
jgi:hypothetical protein